ncbi:nucleoside recognition domain-containing protein [Jeotgalibacillus proteolyticus]|uniref:Nucleoside transporter/FeoB GTPase Gate domain-containing protein n=1 Tax=Jeotgalibacillus proteolyticus TaxID=2082395 RepID=A0A2S5GGJ6_9BACL|nr:nucleoside recognition domain-containing protein [Jeotgalibacillus proteolyticus]PPA72157.1 hypothetical protein C4B60_01910 [Jeotgalibacillus proteolyticus]
MKPQRLYAHLFSAGVFFCLLGLIVHPSDSLNASINGLELWWTIIFPSLLPFFIVADLLTHSNWTAALGKVLEPIMKPLFNVSGQGAIVLLLGFTSGFPVGAKLSVQLFEQGKLSLADAQRLVCFTNGSSPVFVLGAIAAGLLNAPELGFFLLGSHYLSNIIIGLIAGRVIKEQSVKRINLISSTAPPPLQFGTVLQSAVTKSVQQLLVIGGLIVFFSVISSLAFTFNVFHVPVYLLDLISGHLNQPKGWAEGFMAGILEISNGVASLSEAPNSLMFKCAAILSIISFGGFCIHAQIIACIHNSPIKYGPYFLARLLHMIIAPALFLIAIHMTSSLALPILGSEVSISSIQPLSLQIINWLIVFGPLISIGAIVISIFILVRSAGHKKITWS